MKCAEPDQLCNISFAGFEQCKCQGTVCCRHGCCLCLFCSSVDWAQTIQQTRKKRDGGLPLSSLSLSQSLPSDSEKRRSKFDASLALVSFVQLESRMLPPAGRWTSGRRGRKTKARDRAAEQEHRSESQIGSLHTHASRCGAEGHNRDMETGRRAVGQTDVGVGDLLSGSGVPNGRTDKEGLKKGQTQTLCRTKL